MFSFQRWHVIFGSIVTFIKERHKIMLHKIIVCLTIQTILESIMQHISSLLPFYLFFFIYMYILSCCPDGSDSKKLPALKESQVQSLGQEDPLEKGMATHSSILAQRIPWTKRAWQATVNGVAKSRARLSTNTHTLRVDLQCFRCSARQFSYTHTHTLFLRLFSIIGDYKILTTVPCAIQQTSVALNNMP